MNMDMNINYDPLLNKQETMKYFSYRTRQTMENHMNNGCFPRPDTYIGNSPRWLLSTLNKHKKQLISGNT